MKIELSHSQLALIMIALQSNCIAGEDDRVQDLNEDTIQEIFSNPEFRSELSNRDIETHCSYCETVETLLDRGL